MSIPRRIIQTGPSKELRGLERASQSNIALLHPDWEYVYFDDEAVEAFVTSECPEHVQVYRGFRHHIQRIDFFRYLAVYKRGGFYLDLDVLLWSSLEDLREYGAVFPFEELTLNRYLRTHYGIDWEIGNYAFGGAPGNPFLAAVIENCVRAQREPDWARPMLACIPGLFRQDFEVLNTTGPGILTRTLAELDGDSLDVKILFQPDVRREEFWHLVGQHGVHLMGGSWRTRGGALRRRLARLWERRTRSMCLRESNEHGPNRSFPRVRLQTCDAD
jgi:hypothetical protein